ncbi:B12-binding domain-containing radical SAM protein [Streptomyces syringium]|uniref:B12-binding domain-containing radical SAM protein n=1 Tax=Streptomyces syringium TaxID=76729 RepID=UPI0033F09F17
MTAGGPQPSGIALVNPSVGYSDRRKSKPIGLAYIGAYLRRNGFEASGFDFGDSPEAPGDLSARHGLDRFAMVGFSVYNESLDATLEHAAWIKRRNPAARIVLGGPHATAVHTEIMRDCPDVDVVVRREGEKPMLDLARRGEGSWLDIPGTTVRLPSGEIRANIDSPFLDDLDALPFPDFPFVSDSGYPPLTYFDSSRGTLLPALAVNSSRSCPYNCSFCGVLTIGRKYRMRSGESVVAEMAHFRAADGLDYKHVYFSDANFYVYPKRALLIVQALHAYDPEITFSFGTRVNQLIKHQSFIPDLKECGLRFVELGIESASPQVLKRLAKGVEPADNLGAVRLLERHGLGVSLDFIMIDPETTIEDLRANQAFLRAGGFYDYVPHEHLYTHLVLYAGTPIRDYYEERRGAAFGMSELPPIDTLIEDAATARAHAALVWFRAAYQPAVDLVLAEAEALLQSRARHRERHPVTPDELALQLDVVAARHAPNLFFDNVLDDCERRGGGRAPDASGTPGTPEEFAALLPRPGTGSPGLDGLLLRAAARIDALASRGADGPGVTSRTRALLRTAPPVATVNGVAADGS